MKTDKIIRIRLSTYNRIRRKFPAYPNESLASYFTRLSKSLHQCSGGCSGEAQISFIKPPASKNYKEVKK